MFKKPYTLTLRFFLIVVCLLYINGSFGQKKFNTYLFIDSSGNQSLSQIKQKDFSVLEKDFVQHDWTQLTYWIKITPITSFENNDRIIFSNSYNHYETLYLIDENNVLKSYTFGSNQHNNSATYIPSFELNKKISEIYLSVKSDTFLYESFSIEKSDLVIRGISYYLIFQILIFTYILSLLIFMIVLYVKSKSDVIKVYCVYLVSVFFLGFFLSNLGKYIIWSQLPFSMSYLESFFVLFMVSSYLIFALKVMRTKVHLNWLYRLVQVFIVLYITINIFSVFFLPLRYLSLFANVFPPIALLFVITIAISSFKKERKYIRLYFIGVVFFIVSMLSRLLINWGVFKYSLGIDTFMYLGLVIELVMFTIIVVNKMGHEIKLSIIEKQLIEKGKNKISELEQTIDEITIENKKTPLTDGIVFSEIQNAKLIERLTKREIEVLNELMIDGSQQDIANKLLISISTLKTHAGRVYSKLEVKNRVEAIHKIIELNK